ncbi:hypothetical protein A2U01_0054013, partial [Trifolium medium]|nr:hypothetical protein [Trifolium medium]
MEENVGRGRQGRPSRAHAFARRDDAPNAPPKRGRSRQVPPPFQGRHDDEAGSSAAGSS